MKRILGLAIMLSLVSSISVFAAVTDGNNPDDPTSKSPGMGRRFLGIDGQGARGGLKGNSQDGQGGNGQNGGDICARISDMAAKAQEKMGQIKTPGERFSNWQEKMTEHDAKLAALRAQWNANRDAQFAKLEEKATTDAQKLAVADFEATTKAAISKRQSAVDAAIATFRVGVKNLIVTRQQGVGDDRTAFEAAIKAAFNQAKTDCDNNVAPATVHTNLKNALAAARSKFKLDKQGEPKVGADIQALIATRKQAVDVAMAAFHATMEKARTTLKAAFPNDNSTPGNTSNPEPVQ